MFSIDGLATGIDTTSIIEGLTSIQTRQIERFQVRAAEVTQKKTAFAGVETRLLGLRSAAGRLSRSQNSVFDARTVSSSDETLVTATAGSGAVTGVYSLQVTSLAKAHQIASQSVESAQTTVGEGTFAIRVGSGAETSITVDESNNTMQGLVDAINKSDADVNANLVNDGSGVRLMLTADDTGVTNSISITNNITGTNSPDFSGPAVQEAANASVTLGSGPGAIVIEGESNELNDVLPGISLNLQNVDADTTVTLNVQADVDQAEGAVSDFVDSFNALMEYVDDQVRYIAESDQAGVLTGNHDVISVQNSVRNAMNEIVAGVDGEANRLTAIGIEVTDQGHLDLNTSTLKGILEGRNDDISAADLKELFALGGESDNDGIRFVTASSRSNFDNTDIEVDITQAATRALITAGADMAASTVIDGTNDTLTLTLDSFTSSDLKLTHGTYTQEELAAELQAVINSDSELNGREVSVTVDSNRLSLQSEQYGSASEIEILSGNSLTALGLSSEFAKGTDVIGKFIVNGQIESATGRGQLLVGNNDNSITADLQVRVLLDDAEVGDGAEANMKLTRGIGARLDKLLENLLDPITGRINTINDRFDAQLEDIEASIEKQNEAFESRQNSLLLEFASLESSVAQLQNTGSFLSAQLG